MPALLRVFTQPDEHYTASQFFRSMTSARRYLEQILVKRAAILVDREGVISVIPWKRVLWCDIIRVKNEEEG